MTTNDHGARSAWTAGLGGVLVKLKQRFCSHRFALDDLTMVNKDSGGADRVSWACDKCGKVFRAHCGLDISPEHGPTFRRKTTHNAEFRPTHAASSREVAPGTEG